MSIENFYVEDNKILMLDCKKFSKETVKAALTAHAKFEEKPHIFKKGQVARSSCHLRIICERGDGNGVCSIDRFGTVAGITGQSGFESSGYEYVGELSDYLPKDE